MRAANPDAMSFDSNDLNAPDREWKNKGEGKRINSPYEAYSQGQEKR